MLKEALAEGRGAQLGVRTSVCFLLVLTLLPPCHVPQGKTPLCSVPEAKVVILKVGTVGQP